MNKSYDIRIINGQEVFVKNIIDNFWLFNDVFADLCDDYKVTDKVILDFGHEDDISEYKKKEISMMNQVVSEFSVLIAEGEQYLQRIEKGN